MLLSPLRIDIWINTKELREVEERVEQDWGTTAHCMCNKIITTSSMSFRVIWKTRCSETGPRQQSIRWVVCILLSPRSSFSPQHTSVINSLPLSFQWKKNQWLTLWHLGSVQFRGQQRGQLQDVLMSEGGAVVVPPGVWALRVHCLWRTEKW